MNKLFIKNVALGILIAGNAGGMPNSTPQGIDNSVNGVSNYAVNPNSVGNIRKENLEGNAVFLPVMNRRFSDGMINFSVWPEQRNQNPGMPNSGYPILRQQQNGRELSVQGSANGAYTNQVCNQQKLLAQSVPTSSATFTPQERNGNTDENMIFLPVLRGPDNRNQANNTERLSYSKLRRNSVANAMPQQQYNNQGYFSPAEIDNSIMSPTFTLNDIMQIAERQTQMNREMNQELSNLKQQNEILKKEIQNYRAREMYFFPDKIAQLQGQIMKLEEFIINLNQKHQEEVNKLKNQSQDVKLGRMIILEQKNAELEKENQRYKNENTRETINLLENKVKELQNQIAEKNAMHESELKDLKEKLREEKQLNVTLGLSSGSVLENKS